MTKTVVIDGVEYAPKQQYPLAITGVRTEYEPIHVAGRKVAFAGYPISHFISVTTPCGREIEVEISSESLRKIMEAIQ